MTADRGTARDAPGPPPPPVSLAECGATRRRCAIRSTRALFVLTFTLVSIDAATYLGLGHVFAANMTGNIVLLGFGIAGGGGLPVLAPIVSLRGFLAGAGIGGAARRAVWRRRSDPRLRAGAVRSRRGADRRGT